MLSSSKLPEFVPNYAPVVYGCAVHKGFHSGAGLVMGHVEVMVGE